MERKYGLSRNVHTRCECSCRTKVKSRPDALTLFQMRPVKGQGFEKQKRSFQEMTRE